MKKYIVFFLIFVVGVALGACLFWLYEFNNHSENDENSSEVIENQSISSYESSFSDILSLPNKFKKHGELVNEKSFKVFQVLFSNQALVYGKDEYGYYQGVIYLLIGNFDEEFYDDQIIKVPKGKVVKRYKTFHYETNNGHYKTVPQIMIVDAN